jgi:hypothetical protein
MRNRTNDPMQSVDAADTRARRCGAKTRAGSPCKTPAMANGRCRMHGGKSPGPPLGSQNALKHGERSAARIEERRRLSATLRRMRKDLEAESWLVWA